MNIVRYGGCFFFRQLQEYRARPPIERDKENFITSGINSLIYSSAVDTPKKLDLFSITLNFKKAYYDKVNYPKYQLSKAIPASMIGIVIVTPALRKGIRDLSNITLHNSRGIHPTGDEILIIKAILNNRQNILTFLSNLPLISKKQLNAIIQRIVSTLLPKHLTIQLLQDELARYK